jgi:hypothetical protein
LKGYRNFIIVFSLLLILYIVAEVNKPKPIDWRITLSKSDKNPYGGYILYSQLKDVFPNALIQSFRTPVYNQLNNYSGNLSAYILLSNQFDLSNNDFEEMKAYVSRGNSVFVSALNFKKAFVDTLGFKTFSRVSLLKEDSTSVNFVNPALKASSNFIFKKSTIDEYFSKFDTAKTDILGVNNDGKPNFIKIDFGAGSFFVHSAPLCFSNYFITYQDNAEYIAKALSYIPKNVKKIYWDEYYKLGPGGATTPLRFFLSNEFMLWALRLAIIGLLIYVLFEIKRRQRVIPVITPLRNTTLDFIKTVSTVYYNQKDNNSIASKKVSYFLEYVRQHFYLQTQQLDENFIQQLSRKSGVEKSNVEYLVHLLSEINTGYAVSDKLLLKLNHQIENFYKQAQ